MVVNPGHFHAALTLRLAHPRLSDDVHVYSEDGPDLERFLAIVRAFNERRIAPTRWKLHVYRGQDYLQRLLGERPGRLAVVAGRNDHKMALIAQLHANGFLVLGDKPWIIRPDQLESLRTTATTPPLAMDIMTERHEVAVRLQKALIQREELFGSLLTQGEPPALSLQSVHYLYKLVNGRPLVRPAWYFDVEVQGEGITDVNTHLVDLAQWMTGCGQPFDFEPDVDLISARQWPTQIPRDLFTRITGLDDFPGALRDHVTANVLHYLCNGSIAYRSRGIRVEVEALWRLAITEGGGDTHHIVARGTRAEIAVRLDASTGFRSELTVKPSHADSGCANGLATALAALQPDFPGVSVQRAASAFRIVIPDALRTTHEERFAAVLDEFIRYADSGQFPRNLGSDLLTKYTLLQRARELSHLACSSGP